MTQLSIDVRVSKGPLDIDKVSNHKTMARKRSKRARKYTFLIIPEGRGKIWKREVTWREIESVFGLLIALFFILSGSIGGLAYYRHAYTATEAIRQENARFEEERHKLLTKVSTLEYLVEKAQRAVNQLEVSLNVTTDGVLKGVGPVVDDGVVAPTAAELSANLETPKGKKGYSLEGLDTTLDNMEGTAKAVVDRLDTIYKLSRGRELFLSSVPSIWPTRGLITSGFGPRRRPIRGGTTFHEGIDIAAPQGTPILATGDGIVTFSGYKHGLGNTIIVDHGYGITTTYGHCSENFVKEGDIVKRGELIGTVGRTGLATGTHLHYQVEVDGIPVDPMRYIHEKM